MGAAVILTLGDPLGGEEPIPEHYPDGYQKCPLCAAYMGARCTAAVTSIVGGQTVGPPVELDRPHKPRKLRAPWRSQ